MRHEPIPPFPKNAPGDFYVENECCIACEAPYLESPTLIAQNEGGFRHCYFKRQPETPEEVEKAVMACVVSCVRGVRYAGKDPETLNRFQELNSTDSCDVIAARQPAQARTKSDRNPEPQPPPSHRHPLWDRELDG